MRLLKVLILALGCLSRTASWANTLPDEGAPEWSDEPPRISRWIEEGYAAQQRRQPVLAAENFCAAARFGSVEAQYRLGRLFLERTDEQGRQEGFSLLGMAAQRGHEKARMLLGDLRHNGLWPECLLTGKLAAFELIRSEPVPEPAVPLEVVERYLSTLPKDKLRQAQLIRRLAPRFDVDFRLALAIARAESNFDPSAISPKNAQGLMQLVPDTAVRYGVRNPLDPEQNVRGALAYLRWLLQRFSGDIALTSAAYNAGENAVDRHGGVPPYAETQAYVQRILNFYRAAVHVPPPSM